MPEKSILSGDLIYCRLLYLPLMEAEKTRKKINGDGVSTFGISARTAELPGM